MIVIDLLAVPNQSLSFENGGTIWSIAIKVANNVMVADIARDGVQLVSGMRVVAGTRVMPFEHASEGGNFIFITPMDEIPHWEQFGTTHFFAFVETGDYR